MTHSFSENTLYLQSIFKSILIDKLKLGMYAHTTVWNRKEQDKENKEDTLIWIFFIDLILLTKKIQWL